MREDDPNAPVSDCEIFTKRLLNAPRELVWQALEDPERLKIWWGPNGFTNTIHEFDLRAGGKWRLTMHSADGKNFPNESVFVEVLKPERIVYDHHMPPFRMTISLVAVGQQTEFSFRMRFKSAAERKRIAVFAEPGNEQNFDRLEAHLGLRK